MSAADEITLGADPRPPLRPRTRRLAVGAAVVAVLAAVAAVVVTRWHPTDAPQPQAARTPVVESSAGFAAGPILTSVGGHDALLAPGLPTRGSTVRPVVLDPAPAAIAVVSAALPGFRDVRGGALPAPADHYGLYLAGTYTGAGGGAVTVSLYTARAPGTTFGSDQYVSRTRFDRGYSVRTDVSVFTGTGWWVHVVSIGPDDPGSAARGEIDRLLPLAKAPQLVAEP